MANVTLRSLVKHYDETPAVRGIDLNIADKEFVVLVGPSGCGKTTTLRMIAGLEDITEGDVVIGEHVVNDVPPKDRDIAMVFQNYALYPHMTVYENMSFGLRLKKVPKEEIARRVENAARILAPEDRRRCTPSRKILWALRCRECRPPSQSSRRGLHSPESPSNTRRGGSPRRAGYPPRTANTRDTREKVARLLRCPETQSCRQQILRVSRSPLHREHRSRPRPPPGQVFSVPALRAHDRAPRIQTLARAAARACRPRYSRFPRAVD